ncbi:hypothetical protein GpartN1_g5374.t1 [Galdieria partita]|uniref:Uncharacterized protein n=1 Tax=Galdieria partita TaxID=83374 RepID=A0A9C7USA1_9RHOD|nr:hypothetical protein GpartN1_g5374.t1 [Galdieria partita]
MYSMFSCVGCPLQGNTLSFLSLEYLNKVSCLNRSSFKRNLVQCSIIRPRILLHNKLHQKFKFITRTKSFVSFKMCSQSSHKTEANPASLSSSSSTLSDTRHLAFLLWKNSWISWWAQLVLSVIAGVILLFALSITPIRSAPLVRSSLIGLLSACIALTFSFLSVLWTWGYTRWSIKLQQGEESTAINKLSSSVQSGIVLTVVGMFFTVVAAQAIVGRLLAKILSAGLQPSPLIVNNQNQTVIQPLDIFIVQANTNILLSQWISLTFGLWMAHKLKTKRNKNKPT